MTRDSAGIVVLTYNRKAEVLRTLQRLAELHGRAPIVVVDNASTDGTATAIGQAFPQVQVLRLERNVGAAGRNAGARACAAPYVAFCDDDTWWGRDALEQAAAALDAHPRLAVVTARVLIGEPGREDATSARMAASPFANTLGVDGTEVFGFLAGACMMRRCALLEAGGYHPRYFLGGEEELLAIDFLAAGWRMAYVPAAIVHHHPSRVRDVVVRRRLLPRNAIWSAWLRRPWRSAARETLRRLAEARRDGSLLWSGASALCGLAWVLRERRVVPDHVAMAMHQRDAFDRMPLAGSDVMQRRVVPRRAATSEWALGVESAQGTPQPRLVAVEEIRRRR